LDDGQIFRYLHYAHGAENLKISTSFTDQVTVTKRVVSSAVYVQCLRALSVYIVVRCHSNYLGRHFSWDWARRNNVFENVITWQHRVQT